MILSCFCRTSARKHVYGHSQIFLAGVNNNLPLRMNFLPLLKKHPSSVIVTQWDRSFQSSYRTSHQRERISKQFVDQDFSISHPRQHKIYEVEKRKDGLPEHWVLIFSTIGYGRKVDVVHWLSFALLCILPFAAAYWWWEYEVEENVTFASFDISKRAEVMIFVLLHFFLAQITLRTIRKLPRRIYFNPDADKYLAVARRYMPWRTANIEFTSSEIFDLPSKKWPIKLKLWKEHEFKVKNQIMLFPVSSFRSGHDYDWLMRNLRSQNN